MSGTAWLLFLATVCLDVWGQTAFKIGLAGGEGGSAGVQFWLATAANPWILGGLVGYVVEALCWMYVLGHAPLSGVGPMAATAYVGAVITGRLFLGEQAGFRRWLGAGLVTLGAALVGASLS